MQIRFSSPPLVTLLALAAVGCGTLGTLGTLVGMGPVSAPNPLNAAPLQWSKEPSNVPFEGQKACTTWPIKSTMNVRATDDEICVDASLYELADEQLQRDQPKKIHATSDGSQQEKGGVVGAFTKSLEAQPHKVGSCYDNASHRSRNVWSTALKGCMPNKDINSGKAVLTKESTYLTVGDVRWKFPSAEPAAPASSATLSSAHAGSAR